MGISRSASLILAYLIRHRKMKLHEAIRIVAKQRLIWPNEGFLGKLIQYQNDINKSIDKSNKSIRIFLFLKMIDYFKYTKKNNINFFK